MKNNTILKPNLRCDFCGQATAKNHFPDEFTVLCAHCAAHSGIMGGQAAVEYIATKAKGGTK